MATDLKRAKPVIAADDDGWLDRWFADEEEPDRAALWRLGSWGIAAVAALTVGLLAGEIPAGAKRTDIASAEFANEAHQIDGLRQQTQQDTRRLAAAIETLNRDRDRLFGRLTAVEQGLDSVTGSIAKLPQVSPNPPGQDKAADKSGSMSATPSIAAVAAVPATISTPTPAPLQQAKVEQPKSELSKTEQARLEPPRIESEPASQAKPSTPASDSAARKTDRSEGARAAAAVSDGATASAAAAAQGGPTNLVPADQPKAAASQGAGPVSIQRDAAASDLSGPPQANPSSVSDGGSAAQAAKQADAPAAAPPQIVVAALPPPIPPKEIPQAAPEDETPIAPAQFGIDLGSASSMSGLRAVWNGVRRSHGDELAGLHPILIIRQGKNGLGLQVHVVAGPLADAAAAAKLCATLTADDRTCETTMFDGQRLPLKSDEKSSPGGRPRHRQARQDPPSTPPAKPSMLTTLLGVR